MSKKAYGVGIPAEDPATRGTELALVWAEDAEKAIDLALSRDLWRLNRELVAAHRTALSAWHKPEEEEDKPRQFVVMIDCANSVEYVGTYKCLHSGAAIAHALEEEALSALDPSAVTPMLRVIGIDHELRIGPEYYERVQDGSKTFEIRRNERGYHEGQVVMLREWQREGFEGGRRYSGREHVARIGYVAEYKQQPGYVVFSLSSIL